MSDSDSTPVNTPSRPPVRDRRTGHLLPGGGSLNPLGAGIRKTHRAVLERLIGENGERAYEGILAIAEGRISLEVLSREPKPHEDSVSVALIPTVRRVPSIRERLDAWEFLAEQLNGKAVSSIDLTARVDAAPPQRDYARLTDEELAAAERALRKAVRGDVVDAEIVTP
jgi:hypothetical protein